MAYNTLLNQTITHYASTGKDSYGSLTFGVGNQLSCRFANKNNLVQNANVGQLILYDAKCWVKGTETVNTEDKIVYKSVSYIVSGVKEMVQGNGEVLGKLLYLKKL